MSQHTQGFLAVEPVDVGNGFTLTERATFADDGAQGVSLQLQRTATGAIAASALVTAAENPRHQLALDLGSAAARACALVEQIETTRGDRVAELTLLYCAARRARIMERPNVLVATREAEKIPLEGAAAFRPAGPKVPALVTQRVDLLAHYTCVELERLYAAPSAAFRTREVEESAKRWLATAPTWGFFRAVQTGTLTRAQYVYALSNIYQFVRHTTRLAARAIAHSPTTEMRSHFISHLNGEINHELIIEKDLEHLGEDARYVRDAMAPNGPTQEFMAIQESLIGYYEDPVLLMASPVAAEGVTAHLDEAFVKSLQGCLQSFGVEKPEKASRFFVSHMHTDGGDDGHWEMTVNFLGRCLKDEAKHQFFLRSMRSAMRGTQRLYDSFVEEIPSFGSSSQRSDRGLSVSSVEA
jgi:hypothetical protein